MLLQMSPEGPRTLGVDADAKGYCLYRKKKGLSFIAILNLLCRDP
jgi:hypothetical protein